MLRVVRSLLELIRFSHTVFALPFALTSAVLAWKTDRLSLAATARHPALHGLRPQRGDGVQSPGRPPLRRRQPAHRRPPPAGRPADAPAPSGCSPSSAPPASSPRRCSSVGRPPIPGRCTCPCRCWLFVCAYSLTKRFTALSHFWLGASLLLAPVAAWIAIRGVDAWTIWRRRWCSAARCCSGWRALTSFTPARTWTSTARRGCTACRPRLGVRASLRMALACHVVMLALLVGALLGGRSRYLGWIYLAGVAAVAVLLVYEHWLVRPDDLSRVNQAFFQVNGVISVGLFVVVVVQLALV